MRISTAAAALTVTLVAAQPSPQPTPQLVCSYSPPQYGGGVTYDLTSLASTSGYKIHNSLNTGNDQYYDYWVSVCNDMTPPTTSCQSTCGDDGKCRTGNAPAFQVCNTQSQCGTACHRLGDTAANGNWSVAFNPAHGVSLLYTNGDNCSTPSGFRPRAMYLDFICYDTAGLLPASDEVIEDVTCGYHALLYSRAGCPVQCPFTGYPSHLCGGRGVCDFDTTKQAARCFCDIGWSGQTCSIQGDAGLPPAPSYGGNIAGGFFGGMFAGVAVVAIFVFYKSYTSGQSFVDAFKNLFGGMGGVSLGGLGGGGAHTSSGGYDVAPASDASFGASYPAAPAFGGSAAPSTGGYVAPDTNDGPLLA